VKALMVLRFISVGMGIVVAGLRMGREIRELARSEVAEAAADLGLEADGIDQTEVAAATIRRWQQSTPRMPSAEDMERVQQQFREALTRITHVARQAAEAWSQAERTEQEGDQD
jgi:hypothetical protein